MEKLSLYFIHCGFYDEEISSGIYEFHVSIPVVAANIEEAKRLVRGEPSFIRKKMHIDGIQEIKIVSGFHINLTQKNDSQHSRIKNHLHRDF